MQYLFHNNLDQQVAAIFLAHRSEAGIRVFSIITSFGSWQFLLPVILAIAIALFVASKKEFIIPFIATISGAEIITFFGKILAHRDRPLSAVFHATDFSFPSGHATIAVAFYGYLAFMLIRIGGNRYKWPISILACLIAILIGFSRLYLGVHYLSDVLAGFMIGLTALVVGIKYIRLADPTK
ncbi:MAG: phosphatase PAP2 family protein [Patescibacteria group bacterium]|jgi:undecaprenyl-diphosphatase